MREIGLQPNRNDGIESGEDDEGNFKVLSIAFVLEVSTFVVCAEMDAILADGVEDVDEARGPNRRIHGLCSPFYYNKATILIPSIVSRICADNTRINTSSACQKEGVVHESRSIHLTANRDIIAAIVPHAHHVVHLI